MCLVSRHCTRLRAILRRAFSDVLLCAALHGLLCCAWSFSGGGWFSITGNSKDANVCRAVSPSKRSSRNEMFLLQILFCGKTCTYLTWRKYQDTCPSFQFSKVSYISHRRVKNNFVILLFHKSDFGEWQTSYIWLRNRFSRILLLNVGSRCWWCMHAFSIRRFWVMIGMIYYSEVIYFILIVYT